MDSYAAQEVTPASRFEYSVVDVADKAISDKLKKLLSVGYRSVAFVTPALIVMERGSKDVSNVDEGRVLQGFDAQHIGTELTKATSPGSQHVGMPLHVLRRFNHFLQSLPLRREQLANLVGVSRASF